jgi:sigma-B regulation protein RsbU (phosphoserine phosphatase)
MSNLTPFAPPDFSPTGDDAGGVIVADVSGRRRGGDEGGAVRRSCAPIAAKDPPAGRALLANRYFFSRRNRGHFMTVFAALYRPDARTLS